ncbi:MAG: prepilin-type N-terminal cleavage/methylation domain-containing protein [Actinomycetota bacterium]
MFQRFSKMREEREGGFTLIELLVVILIIAILAAIAIPVFLRQREKGWRSQVESALKNAATAEESYLTVNDVYTTSVTDLETDEGLKTATNVTLEIDVDTGVEYCIYGEHTDLGATEKFWYFSGDGEPVSGTVAADAPDALCPTAIP